MKIRIYPEHPNLPIGPAMGRVGSAMPLAIVGVPSGVTGVAVSVFNADGAACNLDATHRGCEWVATVPASHFASWGKIARGLQVAVSYKDETDATQTVVFVGDVRIEQTAAGDPEGTGRRSVPVTEVDEVEDGSSMKDIRSKVNELARIISGTVTALVLMALPLSAATPLEDIPGTNEVYTAAETDLAISNAIAQIPPPAPSMTTNDVCAIVTNEVVEFTDWVILENGSPYVGIYYLDYNSEGAEYCWRFGRWFEEEGGSRYFISLADLSENASALSLSWVYLENGYTATRQPITRNALGLARLIDLPSLTNDMPSMIASAAQSAISTNNPAFVAAVTNCPVVIATADGTTLGEFGDYGTLGALLAALAAAITWLKTNKADASSLPYALVNVTVENVPYVLGECFPIVYTISGQTTTITDADADGLSISLGNNAYTLYHNGSSLLVMDDGGVYVEPDNPSIESLTFNGVAPTANVTPVLGFTPTAQLTDRAINAVSLTESATLAFPAQTAGKARDFVVRLTLTETDNAVPSVTFPADVAYETEGGEWPDLTEAGTYIVRLTEVPTASESETARFFLQCSSAVADATPPSAGGES